MTISIIGVVLYLILIIALLPIWILAWIVAMLHDALVKKRRLVLYRFRFRGRLLAEWQFDRNQLLDRLHCHITVHTERRVTHAAHELSRARPRLWWPMI